MDPFLIKNNNQYFLKSNYKMKNLSIYLKRSIPSKYTVSAALNILNLSKLLFFYGYPTL